MSYYVEGKEYHGYKLRNINGEFSPFKSRPYDDAEYHYSKSKDEINWKIYYNGKFIEDFKGTFEKMIDRLEMLDRNYRVKPIMVHM